MVKYPDKVTLLVPVCKDQKLLGYARFPNVTVRRTWVLTYLLRPRNQMFWLEKNTVRP